MYKHYYVLVAKKLRSRSFVTTSSPFSLSLQVLLDPKFKDILRQQTNTERNFIQCVETQHYLASCPFSRFGCTACVEGPPLTAFDFWWSDVVEFRSM